MPNPTGVRINRFDPDGQLWMIQRPNGDFYTDPKDNVSAWPLEAAKAIARNVAKKHHTTVVLVKVEELPTDTYDQILEFVNSLKGLALRVEMYDVHHLTKGSDAVASKRERLIAHLLKGCAH